MVEHGILRVSLRARQRLAIGVGSEVSYFTDTHGFVPGSVLRGALAAAWIAENGPPVAGHGWADRFRELFDGGIRYGPLHAEGSSVVPLSVWLCKYPKGGPCGQQAIDRAFESGTTCPVCAGPLEQGKGQVLLPAGTGLERIARTSIDPATAKAKEGELYAHAALPAATTFSGFIHGRDPWLEKPRILRLGGRRTVGGAAEYHVTPQAPPPQPGNGSGDLIIRLASPAIFVDAAGRPRLHPDPESDLHGAAIGQAWIRPTTWSGWHAASRLPKPEELCAAAGSTYRVTGTGQVLQALAERLPREGAGLRRAEGFGDIQIVATPWRPPTVGPAPQQESSADQRLREWNDLIRDFRLGPSQRRWLTAALRALQLERQQPAEHAREPSLTDELLARPAAEEFSGRQRDTLRDLFAEPDPAVLRDLTTLLLADLTASEWAGETTR